MAFTGMTVFLAFALSINLLFVAQANEFLQPMNHALDERVSEEDIQMSLLDEVEGTLGSGTASKRVSQMEAMLRPILAALPKNKDGKLGKKAVHYSLHRLFVQRHGWVIQGLSTNGETLNSSSPSGVLTDQVPAYIEGLFEKRLTQRLRPT